MSQLRAKLLLSFQEERTRILAQRWGRVAPCIHGQDGEKHGSAAPATGLALGQAVIPGPHVSPASRRLNGATVALNTKTTMTCSPTALILAPGSLLCPPQGSLSSP